MNIPASNSILKVYLLGMSERGQKTMQLFFDRHLADCCKIATAAQETQVVIVDSDGYPVEEALQRHLAEFPGQSFRGRIRAWRPIR